MKKLIDFAKEFTSDLHDQSCFIAGFKAGAQHARDHYIHVHNECLRSILKDDTVFYEENFWQTRIKDLESQVVDLESKLEKE